MNEIIKVNYNTNAAPSVSGRELHEALGIKTAYKDWFPRMCEYGFTENEDYTPLIFEHPQNKQPCTDHSLSIPMAKELCMLQRTEKGKEIRRYFIAIEEQWNSPEAIMARRCNSPSGKSNSLKRLLICWKRPWPSSSSKSRS